MTHLIIVENHTRKNDGIIQKWNIIWNIQLCRNHLPNMLYEIKTVISKIIIINSINIKCKNFISFTK